MSRGKGGRAREEKRGGKEGEEREKRGDVFRMDDEDGKHDVVNGEWELRFLIGLSFFFSFSLHLISMDSGQPHSLFKRRV